MTASIKASADGLSAIIQVGGADKVTIGVNGIAAGSYAPQSITPNDLSQKLTLGTSVASTSGTAIDFTGIPSWAKRITVLLSGVSTNGSSVPQLRLGSGSIDATGYTQANGQVVDAAVSSVSNNPTTGFALNGNAWTASIVLHGNIELCLLNPATNLWVASGILGRADSGSINLLGGSKSLSGTLDRIRITTVNGTDTFDAGSINLIYE